MNSAIKAASLLLCLLLWHLATQFKWDLSWLSFARVPSPQQTLAAALELVQSPRLFEHLRSSLRRVFSGYLLAAVAGVLLGVLIGRFRAVRLSLLPPLEVLRPIPAVAWIPLAILMFPSSEGSMIFITFSGAFFPVLLAAMHGAQSTDPRLIASAKSLGASRTAILLEVVLPAAAPAIVSGLAIGMGTCWFCLVTAEMMSGQFGIGYYTWEAYSIQRYPDIVVGMLLIGLLGLISSAAVRGLGALLTPWQRGQEVRT